MQSIIALSHCSLNNFKYVGAARRGRYNVVGTYNYTVVRFVYSVAVTFGNWVTQIQFKICLPRYKGVCSFIKFEFIFYLFWN